jgi:hypothetical protein
MTDLDEPEATAMNTPRSTRERASLSTAGNGSTREGA